MIGINAVVFSSLAVAGARMAWREKAPRLRTLAGAFAAISCAFVLGSLTRLAALAVRQGWLSGDVGDFLVSEWLLLQALAAMALGIAGAIVVRNVMGPLRQADRIIAVLSDRLPADAPIAELGLTARELEVIEVIAEGQLSDKQIADALYISPATAGTHVKNIMRKASVRSRRDLVLLTLSPSDGTSTGRR